MNAKISEDLDRLWNTEEEKHRRWPAYALVRDLPIRGAVLDVGCGTLQDYSYFVQNGWRYYGTDTSHEMLAKARQLHRNALVLQDDILDTKLKTDDYDLVYSASLICHLPLESVDLALTNMMRLSRKYLVIYTPYIHQGSTVSELDPKGYIRNRFGYDDLLRRVSRVGAVLNAIRDGDAVALSVVGLNR